MTIEDNKAPPEHGSVPRPESPDDPCRDAVSAVEAKYMKIFDDSRVGIMIFQGRHIKYANQAALNITGVTFEEAAARPFSEFAHPDDRERVMERFRMAVTGQPVPKGNEFRVRHKDGSIRWIMSSPELIEWGGAPAVLIFCVDLTERKQAEEALKASEEKYRHLVYHATAGIMVFQEEVIKFANPAALDITGYTFEEAVGAHFADYAHPDDVDGVRKRVQLLLKGHRPGRRYEFRVRTKTGRIRWVEASPVMIEWEHRPAVMSFMIDITERRAAEQALRLSEDMYRQLVDNSPAGIMVFQNTGLRFANPSALAITGYTLEEAQNLSLETFVHPDDGPAMLDRLKHSIQGEIHEQPSVFRVFTRSGSVRWVETNSVFTQWEGAAALLTFVMDITERKQSAEVLRIQRDLGVALSLTSDLETALDLTIEAVLQVDDVDGAGVYLAEEDGGIRLAAHSELPAEFLEMTAYYPPGSPQAEVVAAGRPIFGTEMLVDEETGRFGEDLGFHPLACCPIVHEDRSVAALNAASSSVSEFAPGARRIMEACASLLGGAYGRIKAETQKHKSEEKFSKTFKASPDSITLAGLYDGLVLDVNDGFVRTFGYQREEAIGRTDVSVLWSEDDARRRFIRELVETGSCDNMETELLRKDGAPVPCQIAARTIEIDGRTCVISIFRDITERRQADERIKEYQDRLRRLASELALTESRERRRIAGDLHDRVAQTLFLTKMRAEQLRTQVEDDSQSQAAGMMIDSLQDSISYLRTVIGDMSPPALAVLGLEAALMQAADSIAKDYGVHVAVTHDGQPGELDDDLKDLVFLAARELILNAVKHSGATIVHGHVARQDANLVVEILDEGSGFDVESATSLDGGLTHFGLFSIKERLDPLGGRLEVDSEPGKGTRAVLTVPLNR